MQKDPPYRVRAVMGGLVRPSYAELIASPGPLPRHESGGQVEDALGVGVAQAWRMRVVIPDRPQDVASGLVERKAQDGACHRDVEAGLADQGRAQAPLGKAGATRQDREPSSVDLHWTEIVGPVSVVRDAAEMPGFGALDGGSAFGGR